MFKVGDRVEYIGRVHDDFIDQGTLGTVIDVLEPAEDYGYSVEWDDEPNHRLSSRATYGVDEGEIRLATSEPTVEDRAENQSFWDKVAE